MDKFDNDLRKIAHKPFETAVTNFLTNQDGTKRVEYWNGVKDLLANQQLPWFHGTQKVRGRNICQSGVTVIHINTSYTNPNGADGPTEVTISRVDKYHQSIQGAWAKENCKYTLIRFSHGDEAYTLNIPAEAAVYEVKDNYKYVPAAIRSQAERDMVDFYNEKKGTHALLEQTNIVATYTTLMKIKLASMIIYSISMDFM